MTMRRVAFGTLLVVVLFSGSAQASVITWNGGTTDWNTAANWNVSGGGNQVPTATDVAVLGGTVLANKPVLGANQSVASLDFEAPGGGWTLTSTGGPRTLNLYNGAYYGSINNYAIYSNNTSGTNTIGSATPANNVNIVLSSGNANAGKWYVAGGGTLDVYGAITGTSGLITGGDGTLNLMGNNTGYNGSIRTNSGTLRLSGGGTLNAITDTSFATAFGGKLLLDNSGTNLPDRLDDGVPLYIYTAELALVGNGAGTSSETVGKLLPAYYGVPLATVDANGGGGTTLTFAGVGGIGTVARTDDGRFGPIMFRGTSLGSTPGSGVGTVKFTDTTGLLPTTGGAVVPWAMASTSLTATTGEFATYNSTNGVGVLSSFTTNNLTAGSNTNVKLTAGQNIGGSNYTINSLTIDGGTGISGSGTLTVNSGGTLVKTGVTAAVTAPISVPATWTGTVGEAVFNVFGTASLTIGELAIGGTSKQVLNKSGEGTLTLTDTTPQALYGVYVSGGTLQTTGAIFQAMLGYTGTASRGIYLGNNTTLRLTDSSANMPSTLLYTAQMPSTIDVAAGLTLTLNGTRKISGARSFTKIGAGTLEVTSYHMFANDQDSGKVVIKEGTWAATILDNYSIVGGTRYDSSIGAQYATGGFMAGAASIELDGGTLKYVGALVSMDRLFSLGATGAIDASGTGTLTFNGTNAIGRTVALLSSSTTHTLTLTGANTGANTFSLLLPNGVGATSLVKNGMGKWVLDQAEAFTGDTTVSAGTLALSGSGSLASGNIIVNGTLDVSARTDNTLTLASGQRLKGTGNVVGSVIVGNSSMLAPGASPGELTVDWTTVWDTAGIYEWEISDADGAAGADWDLLSTDALAITATAGSPFTVKLFSLSLANFDNTQNYVWTIAHTASGVSGFDTDGRIALDPAGFTEDLAGGSFGIQLSGDGNDVQLTFTPVPEPATLGLLALGGLSMLGAAVRRRRSA